MDKDTASMPQIPGYEIESILGVGGMATVYLAVQESLSRHVALKVMNQMLVLDPGFRKRFLNEGRLVAQLTHPNIVTVHDIGAAGISHYIAMSYLPGGTLREQIRTHLTLERTLEIAKSVASALGYAHDHGIVHRDIKPENVMFSESGAPVLTDFGIAKTVGANTQLTSTGMMIGSARFMSPEQAIGHEVDNRADLYSLGVLLWQMLTGTYPYEANDPFALALKHAKDPIPDLPDHLSMLQPLIGRLLAKKPDDRYANAQDLVKALEAISIPDLSSAVGFADETLIIGRPPSEVEQSDKPHTGGGEASIPARTKRPTALIVGAAALAVAGVGSYLAYELYRSDASQGRYPPPAVAQEAAVSNRVGVEEAPGPATRGGTVRDRQRQASLPGEPRVQGDPSFVGEGDLSKLLGAADAHWLEGRITDPPGDNAFVLYRQVLALDPENETAKKRLLEIGRMSVAQRQIDATRAFLEGGDLQGAAVRVERGLMIAPENDSLLALREEIRARRAGKTEENGRTREIEALLQAAAVQWEAGHLTEPPGDNAFESYRRVLMLDPENTKAREQMVAIGRINAVDKVFRSAEHFLRSGRLDDASRMIDTGLKMSPGDARLLKLKQSLEPKSGS